MGLYDRWVLPRMLDFAMRQKPISMQRQKVVPQASGRVLEIGIGSGLNLAFYDRGRVTKLWGLEPSEELRRVASERARAAGMEVEFLGLPGEQIPLDAASVDTVVTTYTLCTIPGVERALGEMRRVLAPGGTMLFSEHGRAPDTDVARWQDRLDPFWGYVSGGCHLNRSIAQLIGDAGFRMSALDTMYVPGPRPFTYTYWGSAQRD